MLLRHYLAYMLARGVPGVVNLLTLVVLTRLLDPESYGRYALTIAGAGLVNIVLFQWIKLAATRFLPAAQGERQHDLIAALIRIFFFLTAFGGALTVTAALLAPASLASLLWIGGLLALVQAWFEFGQELARGRLDPKLFGLLALSRAVLALGCGAGLVLAGFGAVGALWGAIAGYLISALPLFVRRVVRDKALSGAHRGWVRRFAAYGLPLTATVVLVFVVDTSDRFMLAAYLGEAVTGAYSAAYNLVQQSLGVLMTIVNLAAYPLAARAADAGNKSDARRQLAASGELLMAVGLPAATGLTLLSDEFTAALLGPQFQNGASLVVPLIAFAILLATLKSFYWDLAFQLSHRTVAQIWIAAAAALINVLLNVVLIPRWGMIGAAWATLAAFGAGMLLSFVLGRRIYPMPIPLRSWSRIGVATGVMALAVSPSWLGDGGVVEVVGRVLVGVLVYGGCAVLLDICGIRAALTGTRVGGMVHHLLKGKTG